MSQDFFADLERQLVAATAERGRRLRRARARRAATLSTILVAVLAAGAGLAAAVTGGAGGGDPARHSSPAGHAATRSTTAPAVEAPTVAVLNGTPVPGLARGVANRLQEGDFKIGNVTNAPSNHFSGTSVYFVRPSSTTAVLRVMRQIGLRRRGIIRAAPADLRVVAGKDADVIVVVGSDQNTDLRP
jgi:hypothetical protein